MVCSKIFVEKFLHRFFYREFLKIFLYREFFKVYCCHQCRVGNMLSVRIFVLSLIYRRLGPLTLTLTQRRLSTTPTVQLLYTYCIYFRIGYSNSNSGNYFAQNNRARHTFFPLSSSEFGFELEDHSKSHIST
jgi:hypothetical protein